MKKLFMTLLVVAMAVAVGALVVGCGSSQSTEASDVQEPPAGAEESAAESEAEAGAEAATQVETEVASTEEEQPDEEAEDAAEDTAAVAEDAQAVEDDATTGGKTLVVCWSQTGNTQPLAEYVAEYTGADFYQIEAVEPYTEADLDYNDPTTRATVEQKETPEVRPAIAGDLPDMAQYDTVFIAHPIWWGKAPRIVLTFTESVDLSGKTVVEFVTSGSSGIEGAEDEMHAAAPDANWLQGQRFEAGTSREEMEAWVDSLGLA